MNADQTIFTGTEQECAAVSTYINQRCESDTRVVRNGDDYEVRPEWPIGQKTRYVSNAVFDRMVALVAGYFADLDAAFYDTERQRLNISVGKWVLMPQALREKLERDCSTLA